MPILPVKVSYGHGAQSPRIEALVDSGAADCLFRSDIGQRIGIRKIANGPMEPMGGIAVGVKIPVYYHSVKLWVGFDCINVVVGFTDNLPVAALLGRRGFFEHFTVTFDPANNPPGFEIKRLGRA